MPALAHHLFMRRRGWGFSHAITAQLNRSLSCRVCCTGGVGALSPPLRHPHGPHPCNLGPGHRHAATRSCGAQSPGIPQHGGNTHVHACTHAPRGRRKWGKPGAACAPTSTQPMGQHSSPLSPKPAFPFPPSSSIHLTPHNLSHSPCLLRLMHYPGSSSQRIQR